MPFKKHGRQYDIVVFGATGKIAPSVSSASCSHRAPGYTGVLTAEHIAAHFPTDLKWAVAGRSLGKLQKVVSRCMDVNADRVQPGTYSPQVHQRIKVPF